MYCSHTQKDREVVGGVGGHLASNKTLGMGAQVRVGGSAGVGVVCLCLLLKYGYIEEGFGA